MNEEYKTFEELKEELGNKFDEYMYKSNIELLEQLQQRDEVIEKAINKLGKYADEMNNNGNAYAICLDILDTLKKHKGGNNE